MKIEQVAIQLYTLRERMKTRQDLETTLRRVKEIGYPAVQISGLSWDVISEPEMAALCARVGLTICATHEPSRLNLDHPEKVVERLKALGCRHTAYPFPAGVDLGKEEEVKALIAGLEKSGRVLARAGMTLCYHNHHHEFRRLGGRTILEAIYDGTSPDALQAELDTYWVQYGGGDPTRWCRRMKGRLPLLHMKDYAIDEKSQVIFCEIGSGNLDFKSIVAAAEASGCQWFIVEQDSCPGDEFASIAKSFDYIRGNLVSAS